MMKQLFVMFITILFIAGCGDNADVVTEDNGLRYTNDTVGTGREAKIGDVVAVHFKAWRVQDKDMDTDELFADWSKDSSKAEYMLQSSRRDTEPVKFVLGDSVFIKGSHEAIAGMKAGGTRTIIIPSDLAYGKEGIGPIPPDTDLKVLIELISVKDKVTAEEWNVDSSQYKTTESGLKYVVLKEGDGEPIKTGDVVTVHYTGYLTDGRKFDSSVERDTPFKFALGLQPVIKGWEEGIKLLSRGAKGKFIIPAELGYGANDNGPIPGNSTLVFDVEVLEVER